MELTDVLKNHGFSRIAIEADTLVVVYNSVCTRCDIESSWNKTIQGFKKHTKDLIPKNEISQAVISFISERWLQLQEKRSQQAVEQWEYLQRHQKGQPQEGQKQEEQEQKLRNDDNHVTDMERNRK